MKPRSRWLLVALLAVVSARADAADDEAASFDSLFPVLAHPRCTNCHSGDARPWWTTRAHGFNVSAGADGHGEPGARCVSCHSFRNAPAAHGPPGVKGWALAPIDAGWRERSLAAICAQIKDPRLTKGKDLAAIAEHLETDALVRWAWAPGPGRAPAPGTHPEFVAAFRAWVSAGATCPQ